MEKNKEDILRKISGLLKMKEGNANENESNVAGLKAAKLLAQYQISEAEVMMWRIENGDAVSTDNDVFRDFDGLEILLFDNGAKNPMIVEICTVIGEVFGCKMYINSGAGTIHFIGSGNDIEVCSYFAEVIHNYVEAEAWKKYTKKNDYRNRLFFWIGAGETIKARLMLIKKEMEVEIQSHVKGRELIITKDSLVEMEFEKMKKRDGFKSVANFDKKANNAIKNGIEKNAYMSGAEAGSKAPLNRAIN